MKKCILIFALLIMALLLTVFTEKKKNSELEPSYSDRHQLAVDGLVVENRAIKEKHKDTIE